MVGVSDEQTPLLPSDRAHTQRLLSGTQASSGIPTNTNSSTNSHTGADSGRLHTAAHAARVQTHRFLTSKAGHYAVLLLVTLDVACIFADFLISLYRCERFCCGQHGGGNDGQERGFEIAQEVLEYVSIAFSSLFLAELLASILGYGPREFLKSKFRIFDGLVISASFVLDVCLKGVLEEIGSVVIVLRLWRVFKIIEELGVEAQENMEKMEERIEAEKTINRQLRQQLQEVYNGQKSDGQRVQNACHD